MHISEKFFPGADAISKLYEDLWVECYYASNNRFAREIEEFLQTPVMIPFKDSDFCCEDYYLSEKERESKYCNLGERLSNVHGLRTRLIEARQNIAAEHPVGIELDKAIISCNGWIKFMENHIVSKEVFDLMHSCLEDLWYEAMIDGGNYMSRSVNELFHHQCLGIFWDPTFDDAAHAIPDIDRFLAASRFGERVASAKSIKERLLLAREKLTDKQPDMVKAIDEFIPKLDYFIKILS